MPKQDVPTILVLALAGTLTLSGPGTGFAADPLAVPPQTPVPETADPGEEILEDLPLDPHMDFLQASALSEASPLSVSHLQQYPHV